ncbi:MAG: thiolase family protein [Thaumarchaeota archaeon]|nr:thiolase family protein [Nitrososphaerota archaeon]
MQEFGTKDTQLGKIAVQQRENASNNPNSYLKKRITIEDYLTSEVISDPIRKLDCCIRVNGGLGVILARKDIAVKLTDKPVFLKGIGGSFNYSYGDSNQPSITHSGFREASRICSEIAGIKPEDCSLYELYDDYTIMTLVEMEDLGLCKKGEGGKLIERSDLSPTGDLPLNTGGGLLSSGQPGLAGGFVPLVEAVRQLQFEAVGRQVPDAVTAVVTGGGGLAFGKNLTNCMTAILGV